MWPRFGRVAAAAATWCFMQGATQIVSSPNLDLSSLGQVALAGNFDAISVYASSGQREGFSNNGTQSVVALSGDGRYRVIASTDASINSMCPLILRDGTVGGLVIAGNFTSVGGIGSRSVAIIDPNTLAIIAAPGIQGTVSAIFCDRATESVYVGGSFVAASSTNAIAWVANKGWANMPFAGFDAPVTSITRASNGHIIFGGSFTGLGNSSVSVRSGSENQAINLGASIITSGSNTTSGNTIVCPANSSSASTSDWFLRDNSPGFWSADLQYGFRPTKLRLWNTKASGRGVKTFRFTASPINGIMNFTYTDPATGRTASCESTCPLSQNSSIPYQDFFFVNSVGMSSFRIDVSDWYGMGGGLHGIELFQSDVFSYAIDAYNEPACSGSQIVSTASSTGPWYRTPSRESSSDYLTAVTGPMTVGTTQIVFRPNIKQSGNYSIIVYTPGCRQDSSCSARGIVNVTGTLTTNGGTTFSSTLYQTNDFEKFDQVFQGYMDASTTAFRPAVTIRASGLRTDQLIVASRVKFDVLSTTGGLNGLFDFDPNIAIVDMDFSKSAINTVGTKLDPGASVLALASHDNTVYAGGRFSDDIFENIMAFVSNNATSLPNGGLNAAVISLYSTADFLYVGGNFTNTATGRIEGLNNLASYQYSTNSWVPLGAGVNGAVTHIAPLQLNITSNSTETVIAFSGDFTSINANGSSNAIVVNGFAVWIPSQKTWLQNIRAPKQILAGQLFSATYLPNGTWFGGGSLTSLGQAISGAVGLQSTNGQVGLQQLPIQITPSTAATSSRKRALSQQQNVTGISTVTYYNNQNRNVTIFGGHFSASTTGGSTAENLLFLNGSANNIVTGLPAGVDSNSTFLALAVQNDLLFAGGSVSGRVSNVAVSGLVVYDLYTAAYRSPQPAALVGQEVVVSSVAVQPGSSRVYVGGTFEKTSQDLSCAAVCMYDTSTNQWNTVGSGLRGSVATLYWSSNTRLVVTGNLTVGGNSTYIATYDSNQQAWTAMQTSNIPGPVNVFAPGTMDANTMWISGTASNGSTYLIEANGQDYRPVPNVFGSNTVVRGLQVMTLTSSHGSVQYFDQDQALLVTGQLNLTGFGAASAALFNGTTMNPFILSSNSSGGDGSISGLYSSNTNTLKSGGPRHSTGITVLVSLCAALGTIFLIILIGIILNRIQRRRAGYSTVPTSQSIKPRSNINRVPPEHLFGSLGQKSKTGMV